jgi:lysophospholipase L1-like esterase
MTTLPGRNPSIVFLGDSIAWGFASGAGAPLWSAFWAPVGAADYGVLGQTTQSLLYQLDLGQLVGTHPAVAVLIIGTNNLLEGDSPQDTAAGIVADVDAIHQYVPAAQVIVLGLPPGAPNPTDPYRLAAGQTDALVSQMLAGDSHATFVDIAPGFEQPDGSINNFTLFFGIHPTTLGYLILTEDLAAPIVEAYSNS